MPARDWLEEAWGTASCASTWALPSCFLSIHPPSEDILGRTSCPLKARWPTTLLSKPGPSLSRMGKPCGADAKVKPGLGLKRAEKELGPLPVRGPERIPAHRRRAVATPGHLRVSWRGIPREGKLGKEMTPGAGPRGASGDPQRLTYHHRPLLLAVRAAGKAASARSSAAETQLGSSAQRPMACLVLPTLLLAVAAA